MGWGGVALSSLLYLPPACLPAVVVALLADLLPVHSARVRPSFCHLLCSPGSGRKIFRRLPA